MTQLRFTIAQQVFDAFPTLQNIVTKKPTDIEPIVYMRGLISSDAPEQALSFCAYLLPKRDAVRWLCQLLRLPSTALLPSDDAILKSAEEWVRSPNEPNRIAALAEGMADRDKRPAAWAAIAAGWSGGNISSDDKHPVPPPVHLTAHGVTVGLNLLVSPIVKQLQAEKIEEYISHAIRMLKQEK